MVYIGLTVLCNQEQPLSRAVALRFAAILSRRETVAQKTFHTSTTPTHNFPMPLVGDRFRTISVCLCSTQFSPCVIHTLSYIKPERSVSVIMITCCTIYLPIHTCKRSRSRSNKSAFRFREKVWHNSCSIGRRLPVFYTFPTCRVQHLSVNNHRAR